MVLRWRKFENIPWDPHLTINFSNQHSIKYLETAHYNLLALVTEKTT